MTLAFGNTAPADAQNGWKDVQSYTIQVSDAALADLQHRLAHTRLPDEPNGAHWDYGTNRAYLQELITYWAKGYDWRAQETRLNRQHHYLASVQGQKLHFVFEKGKGKRNIPLVLLHGWPSSFLQMEKIVPLLTDPAKAGLGGDVAFDVIIPSLPGYGFSDKPSEKGMNVYAMSELLHGLMTRHLGYTRFMLRGSDIGAGVAKEWAMSHPEAVSGLHLSGSNPYVYQVPQDLTEEEKVFIQKGQQFFQAEGAYAVEQSTKPQTLAVGLNDSPAGLASWLVEKYRGWSDNGGNLERSFNKDDLLTQVSLYWFTETIGASMRVYYESAHVWSPNAAKTVTVPTAFMMLEKDIAVAPRSWEARTYTIVRWNTHPNGGHFGEWEEPTVLAKDILAFAATLK